MNEINALLPDIRLRFNMNHPELEACYSFGYECAASDVSEDENPFPMGSKEAYEWAEGWWAGFYGEEPLYAVASIHDVESELHHAAAPANDSVYHKQTGFLMKVLELTGVIAVSALVGYQMMELVA